MLPLSVSSEELTGLYWAARFLQDSHTRQQQALDALPGLVDQLNRLMAEARGV